MNNYMTLCESIFYNILLNHKIKHNFNPNILRIGHYAFKYISSLRLNIPKLFYQFKYI